MANLRQRRAPEGGVDQCRVKEVLVDDNIELRPLHVWLEARLCTATLHAVGCLAPSYSYDVSLLF